MTRAVTERAATPSSPTAAADRAGVRGRRRRLRARRRGADAALRPRRDRDRGPRGLHDRADGADQHRPGAAQLRRRDARARWSSCSARPSAGRATTHSFLWAQRRARSCRASPARRRSRCRCRAPTTSSSRRPSTSTALPDGEVPLTLPLHRHGPLRAATTGGCRSCSIPWSCSARVAHAGRGLAGDDGAHYPGGGWVRLQPTRSPRCSRAARRARAAVARRLRRRRCWGRTDMDPALEELVDTLLYEGYALYPYTPGATKNATPTPFGIVYPPAYAQATPSTFDQLRMQGIAHADGDAVLTGEVRFLQARGGEPPGGRRGASRRPDARSPSSRPSRTSSPSSTADCTGACGCRADDLGDGRWRVTLCVHNTTAVRRGPRPRRRRCALEPALHAPRRCGSTAGASSRRRALEAPASGRTCERQHLPGARDARPTTPCSARRSCCPTTRSSRPRAAATCSTAPRSRRRCCCTCSRCPTTSARQIAAAGPGGARDGRARRCRDARGRCMALHGRVDDGAIRRRPRRRAAGRARGRGRRRHLPARRQGRAAPRRSTATPTTGCSTAACATIERIYVDYDDSSTSA